MGGKEEVKHGEQADAQGKDGTGQMERKKLGSALACSKGGKEDRMGQDTE